MPRRWWTLWRWACHLHTYLDNNVTNVAIPTIQRDLQSVDRGPGVVVSSYILVFAGLLLAGGRLGRRVRPRRCRDRLSVFHGRVAAAGWPAAARADRARLLQAWAPRSCADHAGDHHGDLRQRQGAGDRDRRLDRDRRDGAGVRPADRRVHQPAPALGLDLFINVPIGIITLVIGMLSIPRSRARRHRQARRARPAPRPSPCSR